jgi:hypothetical protein
MVGVKFDQICLHPGTEFVAASAVNDDHVLHAKRLCDRLKRVPRVTRRTLYFASHLCWHPASPPEATPIQKCAASRV